MKKPKVSMADFIACLQRAGFMPRNANGVDKDFVSQFQGYIRVCLVSGHWMHVPGYPQPITYGQTLAELQQHLSRRTNETLQNRSTEPDQ